VNDEDTVIDTPTGDEDTVADDAPADHDAEAAGRPGRASRGSARLYFAAFGLVLVSFGALVLGGLSLIGEGLSGSPTGYFWLSIVVSVVALVLAVAAVFSTRRG
jgi:hypothetical protein